MKVNLNRFIGHQQLRFLRQLCRGEEGVHFRALLERLEETIATMPQTYGTEGQGDQSIAYLHYFSGGSDWWITERDCEEEQLQAFGFACLNGWRDCAEFGYVSISELIACNVEIDCYWKPTSIAEIKKRMAVAA